MVICRLKHFSLAFAIFAFALVTFGSLNARAQQVTYYDFNGPQADTSQYSYACSPNLTPSPLFCINYQNTPTYDNDPTNFLLDTYPASIDPILTDNPPVSGSFYATQMTFPAAGQRASLWFSVPQVVANGFTSWFAFKFTPNTNSYATADGIAFVVQNSHGINTSSPGPLTCLASGSGPTALGDGGGCMGYGGIDNSLALEFDTYNNGSGIDPDDLGGSSNDNHIALQDCGAGLLNSPVHYPFNNGGANENCSVSLGPLSNPVSTLVSNPQSSTPNGGTVTLADGNVHQVVVNYSGPTEATPNLLQVFIDPPFVPGTHTPDSTAVPVISGTFDINTALNLLNSGTANDSAYVGFTSATGSAFEQHELMAWTFTPHTPVTQQQPLQPPGGTTYQPFPFGSHTYGVLYPAIGPPTSGISMTVTATTVTPAFFSTLISGTPFQGSACQVYDDTGGNCVIYSVSCSVTGSNPVQPAQCPAVTSVPDCNGANAAQCIDVKTTFDSDNTVTPVSPGYLQGDPFYSQISSLSVTGDTATFTCTGECSVSLGQTVSVIQADPAFNGSYTVTSISAPNAFIAQTAVLASGSATNPGYLTSSNVQNIFTSYTPQNIDGTTKGTTLNFSDFVFTSVTNNASIGVQLSADPSTLTINQPDQLTATVTGNPSQTAAPTGNVLFYAGSTLLCTSPVSTLAGITTATCSYTPTDATPVVLSAEYTGDTSHLLGYSNQLNLTPTGGTPTVTFVPSPNTQTYGTPISAGALDATAASNNVAVPGTFAYTTTINAVPNQPVVAGVTILPTGSYTITATFTPTSSSYTTATATAGYSVTQATLTVTWPAAGAITYGQTLTSSTLSGGSAHNGATLVPGNFTFTAPTTAPGAGPQSEAVTFTPNDSTDYAPVSSTVSVLVNKAPTTVSILPTATAITSGQTLASSILSGGKVVSTITGATVPGSFTFTNPLLAPLTTASQAVTFTPTDAIDYLGTTASVSVTVSAAAVAYISPSSIDFGTLYLGSIVTKTVTITNKGNAAMTISDPFIAIVRGGNSKEFITLNLCPKSLAAGKSCLMTVTFVAGPFYTQQNATLSITDSAPGSPQTVPLTALVINPVAQYSPTNLSFGTAKTNSGSVTKSITLTSTGGTALTITKYAIAGSDPGDFSETNTCSATMNPKASCSITVTFKPKAKGTRTATLVVTDNAQSGSQSIPLSGTGN
jgi:hypothetical protein